MLSGTGTAGAYHAGAIRALLEAGVKLDLVAGRGIGAVGALFVAADAATRLWEADGLWHRAVRVRPYGWRWPYVVAGLGLAAVALLLVAPVAALVAGALLVPVSLVAGSGAPAQAFTAFVATLLTPATLVTWVLRPVAALLLALVVAGALAAVWSRGGRGRRRTAGAPWWRALGPPLSAASVVDWATTGLWDYMRAATAVGKPSDAELSARCAELLGDNLGQPGYRELMLVAHDADTHRDLVFALLANPLRQSFAGLDGGPGSDARRAEVVDLLGLGRSLVIDGLAAALHVPLATDGFEVSFPGDSPWRGETHRLYDRPGAIARLLQEVSAAGAEQVILVTADEPPRGPHALEPIQRDFKRAVGGALGSVEAAATRDAVGALFDRFTSLYHVRPAHNPLGPFDFGGVRDERSQRRQTLAELMARGYEDAYHQFIEPALAEGAHKE